MAAEDETSETPAFDSDDPPTVELSGIDGHSPLGLGKLEDLGVVELETERRDGDEVVTDCRINLSNLTAMATEFHVVERRYGDRWELGSWDPDVRILDEE